ncbi:MAG: 4'-phosphopantetheinyl transferase superfamily protein [Balneolia bacterium]|nr:4'-phosphopantetheinyl transferase superfamily protein [Balneolia bacterium]
MMKYREQTTESQDFKSLAGLEKPDSNELHIWITTLEELHDISDYSSYYLDTAEQERAQAFRFRKDRDSFITGRYVIKTLLGMYSNTSPEHVRLEKDDFGKPFCSQDICFNLSHSGDKLMVGFSGRDIGVDVEKINPSVEVEKIGKNHFSNEEYQLLMEKDPEEKQTFFYNIWTRKEAVIKAIGKGLGIPLKSFYVITPGGRVLWDSPTSLNYGDWYVLPVVAGAGYKAAVATPIEIPEMKVFELRNDGEAKSETG